MSAWNLYRIERRSLKDRRRPYRLSRLTYRGVERRRDQKHRSQGWLGAGEQVVQCVLTGLKNRKIFEVDRYQIRRSGHDR
jgi:hypothetical protein